ncbi:hypothetical protein ACHAXA_001502 [Cyclostephanos tholiformis]|uniref:tRNA-uridine aminocarboxypropyltransferase n=1 Tax=Cyclostephanos tholiformis TaxID=382380 RepID=A0ABD3RWJ3_9STRA
MSGAVAGRDDDRKNGGAVMHAVEVDRDLPRSLSSSSSGTSSRHEFKRPVCRDCDYPTRTCLCPSLPPRPIHSLLRKCRIVVMQHPHELRRKNRSLPIVELCMFGGGNRNGGGDCDARSMGGKDETKINSNEGDFVMKTIVGRRFGDHCDVDVMKILRDPNEVVVLVFPHKRALDLDEGVRLAEERCGIDHDDIDENELHEDDSMKVIDSASRLRGTTRRKMTLVFIDATWKHAKEMERATDDAGQWPENLIRVQMTPSSTGYGIGHVEGGMDDDNDIFDRESNAKHGNKGGERFIERRFRIRTPPSSDHLSTAESIAWIASRVERNPQIYDSIVKALDYMVEIWTSNFTADDNTEKGKSGESQLMSQKKLKII